MRINFVLLLVLISSVYANNNLILNLNNNNDFISINKLEQNINQPNKENKFRRGEILFFISLPFTFLYSYMLVESAKLITRNDNIKKNGIDLNFLFIGVNSIGWSFAISYNDFVKDKKE